jgi:hypothetical protein
VLDRTYGPTTRMRVAYETHPHHSNWSTSPSYPAAAQTTRLTQGMDRPQGPVTPVIATSLCGFPVSLLVRRSRQEVRLLPLAHPPSHQQKTGSDVAVA